jgi:hypothetical protein
MEKEITDSLKSRRCRSIGHSRKFAPHRPEKMKRKYVYRLLGTNSLKEGKMWHVL